MKRPARKPQRRGRAQPRAIDLSQLVISPTTLKWLIGLATGLIAFIIGYNQLKDQIDSHWRLETVQQAKEREQDARERAIKAEIQAAKEKSESDTKALARRAEQGRAWLFWSVIDSKALNTEQFAEICKSLKRPGEVCTKYERDAVQFRQEALDAKRAATDSGKEK